MILGHTGEGNGPGRPRATSTSSQPSRQGGELPLLRRPRPLPAARDQLQGLQALSTRGRRRDHLRRLLRIAGDGGQADAGSSPGSRSRRLPARPGRPCAGMPAGCGDEDEPRGLTKQVVAFDDVPPPVMEAAKKARARRQASTRPGRTSSRRGEAHSYEVRGRDPARRARSARSASASRRQGPREGRLINPIRDGRGRPDDGNPLLFNSRDRQCSSGPRRLRFRQAAAMVMRRSRVHADRAAGRHRHHRRPDRPAAARRPGGPRGGPPHPVHQQPQADRPRPAQLREHHRRLPDVGHRRRLGEDLSADQRLQRPRPRPAATWSRASRSTRSTSPSTTARRRTSRSSAWPCLVLPLPERHQQGPADPVRRRRERPRAS